MARIMLLYKIKRKGDMKMKNKIKYIGNAVKWFDKVNGNTYHSVRITRTEDGAVITAPFQYGYGEHYRQSAIETMIKAGWIKGYDRDNQYLYERENDYPIQWIVSDGKKKECIANGTN
jgi:hypothetical protein